MRSHSCKVAIRKDLGRHIELVTVSIRQSLGFRCAALMRAAYFTERALRDIWWKRIAFCVRCRMLL